MARASDWRLCGKQKRRWVCALWAAGLTVMAGCGLSDYEAKMGFEQARLQYFDDENRLLEGPVKWPEKPDKKDGDKAADAAQAIPANEVFFRPPKGIALTPDEKPSSGLLYRYPATQPGSAAVQEVYLAVVKAKSREEFQKDVLRILGGAGTPTPKELGQRSGRKPMPFQTVSYVDPRNQTTLSFNFYQEEPYQAAVVFRLTTAENPAVEYSLGSLTLGSAAAQQQRAYQARPDSRGPASKGRGS